MYIWVGGALPLSLQACVWGSSDFHSLELWLYPDLSRNKSSMLCNTRVSHFIWRKCSPCPWNLILFIPLSKEEVVQRQCGLFLSMAVVGTAKLPSQAHHPFRTGHCLSSPGLFPLLDLSEDPGALLVWTLLSQKLGKLRSQALGYLRQ